MIIHLKTILVLLLPSLCRSNNHEFSWIASCASQGLAPERLTDQPIPGSVAQELVSCMVEHVMTASYTLEEVQLAPCEDEWCLPDDFLSAKRTCASLLFDIFAPLRYCIENEGFSDLSSDTQYAQGFNTTTLSSFYLSSRLTLAMCGLLDGLHGNRECLVEACRQASYAPSQVPSSQPSIVPSLHPSQNPSLGPSSVPSIVPSSVPSAVPSGGPSLAPSMNPSSQPTPVASEQPSVQPSSESMAPSGEPSTSPSWYPTPFPSAARSYGPGPFLRVKVTLRTLLDRAENVTVPLTESVVEVLERAIQDSVRSVPGYQSVNITSAAKAPVPVSAPLLVVFRIAAMRECDDGRTNCHDPMEASEIASEFRGVFEDAVEAERFTNFIQRQASRHNVTSLLGVSPRPNSSNLMSSSSFIVTAKAVGEASSACVLSIASVGLIPFVFLVLF